MCYTHVEGYYLSFVNNYSLSTIEINTTRAICLCVILNWTLNASSIRKSIESIRVTHHDRLGRYRLESLIWIHLNGGMNAKSKASDKTLCFVCGFAYKCILGFNGNAHEENPQRRKIKTNDMPIDLIPK